ncbi:hypothetical protein MHYP_G00110900 [Metynnis hypsauchen]
MQILSNAVVENLPSLLVPENAPICVLMDPWPRTEVGTPVFTAGHVLSLTSSFFRGLLERRVPRLSRSRDEDVKVSAALIAVKPSKVRALQPGALS